jgi:hypothetical protein
VIVNDFYVVGIADSPAKANAPLIVDSNTVLTFTVTDGLFQAI